MNICIYTYKYIFIYIYIYTRTYIYVYIYKCIHKCVYIYLGTTRHLTNLKLTSSTLNPTRLKRLPYQYPKLNSKYNPPKPIPPKFKWTKPNSPNPIP